MTRGAQETVARWVDILVSTVGRAELYCTQCSRTLTSVEIAIYTRARPDGPFDAWCADCALVLMEWAAMGANRDVRESQQIPS